MPEIPKIFLHMPRYGPVEMGAAKAFCAPSTSVNMPEECLVQVTYWSEAATSATPSAFNYGFAEALNWRDQGRATHFALIHSDVQPKGPWLNVLWNEMRRSGADCISSVIPIKNFSGRTSTAIGDKHDTWVNKRYVMLEDRAKLPVTFGPKDVCSEDEVLLLNTGLMLFDMRLPCWDDFAFTWEHKITREPDGSRKCWFIPEDWAMSRYLQQQGVEVRATWAVEVIHHGNHGYTNHVE